MRQLVLFVGLAFVTGCRGETANSGGLWFAGLAAGLAAVSSIPSLVRDDRGMVCPEDCPSGYACNRATGLCDHEACAGHCRFGQHCSTSGALEVCVDVAPPLPSPIGDRYFNIPLKELLDLFSHH